VNGISLSAFEKVLPKQNYQELEKLRSDQLESNPIILDKSRQLARNSKLYNEPIYSGARYQHEVNRYRTLRNLEMR
jgi:hypothetical protein